MRSKLLLSLVVAIGAIAGPAAGGAAASPGTLVDLCLTAPADATLNLAAGVPAVQADTITSGVDYTDPSRPCDKFIVDIQVPASSSAPGFLPSFRLTAFTDPEAYPDWNLCPTMEFTSVHRRDARQAGYTHLGTTYLHGHWTTTGECVIKPLPGHDPWPAVLSPPAKGTAVYRILTKARLNIDCDGWCQDGVYSLNRWVRAAHLVAL